MSVSIPPKRIEKLIEEVNKDEVLIDVMNKLILLYKSGALDTAIELLMTIKDMSTVITDDMIDDLVVMVRGLAPLIDGLLNSPLPKLLGESLNDYEIDKAMIRIKGKDAKLSDVIRLLRDKDVLNGLYVFLMTMKSLGRKIKEASLSMS
ncbi:MAG: DUF1641 domain-containing protein [Vulcanisaeta sp.]|jgi:uncharacterized protein YjgD (DUF1641 family)|nr:DUF1641 domain-containing protein [Vulcanisaeta sp.]